MNDVVPLRMRGREARVRNGSEGVSGADISDNRSFGEIIQDVLRDVQRIVQAEIRLGRAEISEKVQQVKNASVFLGGAAVCGALGAACLVTTCIAALALVMPLWLAALLMGILLCSIAAAAFIVGRTRIEQVDPVPHDTVQSVKDTLEWAENHTK